MVSFIDCFNLIVFLIFLVLYSYQLFYALVPLFIKNPQITPKSLHKFAVVIAARNESAVIGELIKSIKGQRYPSELIDIFVVADNCTDDTAQVALNNGAKVYERHNTQFVGKGYALDYIFKNIEKDYRDKNYEAYFIFDADNLLDKNYIYEMNKLFDKGYKILTSYRNSKNYDSNWITAGYSLWFLREAKYINNSRMLLGTSCAISGTGFLIHSDIIRKNKGWKHNLLTEDIEFSVDSIIHGETIGYCEKAILYDEQPSNFEQSWNQRLRWTKGFYQVFGKYGWSLLKSVFKDHRFACYDMLMTIMPSLFLTLLSVMINIGFLIHGVDELGLVSKIGFLSNIDVLHRLALMWRLGMMYNIIRITLHAISASFINFYLVLFSLGLLTTVTEWKSISSSPMKKILYAFTFPIFIFTYIPISIVALFKKIEWVPINHTVVKSIKEITQHM